MNEAPFRQLRYYVIVYKGGLVYDRQVHDVEDFSLNTYVEHMLAHGYGLDITCMTKEDLYRNAYQF